VTRVRDEAHIRRWVGYERGRRAERTSGKNDVKQLDRRWLRGSPLGGREDEGVYKQRACPLLGTLTCTFYLLSNTRSHTDSMYIPNLQGVLTAGLALTGGLLKRES